MTTEENRKRELIEEIRARRAKKERSKKIGRINRRLIAAVIIITISTIMFGTMSHVSAMEIKITEINEFTGLRESQTVWTNGGNVEDVLKEQGFDIGEHDRLNVPADKPVSNNDDIVLTRGKAVRIKIGNREKVASVTKADVADALVEAGYTPGAYDDIKADGDIIELVEVSLVDETTTETIEREIEYVDDPDLPKGSEVVIDEGEDGVKEIRHQVTYTNGTESERTLVDESVAEEPVNKVIARGTKEPEHTKKTLGSSADVEVLPDSTAFRTQTTVSDDGSAINGYKYSRKITMTATAYSTAPEENAGYTTSAMGNQLGYGIAAVDPSVVPLGSKIYVTAPDGSWIYGVASAEDTGGAIKGNRIDLCFPTGAMEFGRRSCVVYVLE